MHARSLPPALPQSSTNPHGLAITDDELKELLAYIACLARVRSRGDGNASFDEYQDYGRDGLLSAWKSWNGTVPFAAFARYCIWCQMRSATRGECRWRFPCGTRSRPDAETLRRKPQMACDQPEGWAWFVRDLTRHWSCMSPTLQQTLTDTLADLPAEVIIARDSIANQTVHKRMAALITFLQRHLHHRETSCQEERERWVCAHASTPVDHTARVERNKAWKTRWRAANQERQRGYDHARILRRRQARTGVADAWHRVSAAP